MGKTILVAGDKTILTLLIDVRMHLFWQNVTLETNSVIYVICLGPEGIWAWLMEKAMAPHSSTFAWKIPWRSLVGCSPWGREESDTTEWLHFHFSLSCIGEGNGNPLQCSCLENPRDGGASWAAVYGVTQSRTWLKRLSSSILQENKVNALKESKEGEDSKKQGLF